MLDIWDGVVDVSVGGLGARMLLHGDGCYYMPKTFHTGFDKKLIGGKALKWIQVNKSRAIAAPTGRQSSNGVVEHTWRTIVQMARAYITDKQVGREMWFFSIHHAGQMLN